MSNDTKLSACEYRELEEDELIHVDCLLVGGIFRRCPMIRS